MVEVKYESDSFGEISTEKFETRKEAETSIVEGLKQCGHFDDGTLADIKSGKVVIYHGCGEFERITLTDLSGD